MQAVQIAQSRKLRKTVHLHHRAGGLWRYDRPGLRGILGNAG